MRPTITLKNYRCFSEQRPVQFEIGPGFTAFVGPNNSGKSSLLRFFHEFREFWGACRPGNPNNEFRGMVQAESSNELGPADTPDPSAVFCDWNGRDLELQLEFKADVNRFETIFRFTRSRASRRWSLRIPQHGWMRSPTELQFDGNLIVGKGGGRVDCSNLFSFANDIEQSVYFAPFRHPISFGSGIYCGMEVGTSFIDEWKRWKTGNNKTKSRALAGLTETIARMFGYSSLEIDTSDEPKTLHLVIDGHPYKLNEVGAGLAEFIYVFGLALFHRPSYIFIDEPELHLHPSLQVDFLTSLGSLAKHGVVFATHSIGLARAVADRIYALRRDGHSTRCEPLESMPNYAQFLGEMGFSSYQALGFDKILLVEGVTDVKTVQQWLRQWDKDHRVVLLPLGGRQFINGEREHELSELKRISPNVSALIDSERSKKDEVLKPEREAFVNVCQRLGIPCHVTARRATENYLSDKAIKEAFGQSRKALGEFARLGQFENEAWSKTDNWRAARHMKRDELKDSDLGQFFDSL